MFASGYRGIVFLFLTTIAPPLLALDLLKYADFAHYEQNNEASRTTLLGIIESCGKSFNLDDDCVIAGFERVEAEENNALAKYITSNYQKALAEGNFNNLECQVETHLQANQIIGHCLLLLHYYAIGDQDFDAAMSQYKMCLHGGLQGLVYQGNIVAQFMLGKLMDQSGFPEAAKSWKEAIKLRKDSDEFLLLKKCYK